MQITTYRYQLPLTMPLHINGATVTQRNGFYANINGAWGEISPPLDASPEQLHAIEQELLLAGQQLRQGGVHGATSPAVQFGLDCALAGISISPLSTNNTLPSFPLLEGPRDPIVRAWRCRRIHPARAWLTLTGDVQYDAGLIRELCVLAPDLRLVLDAKSQLDSEQLSALWQRIDGSRIDWLLDPATDMLAGQHIGEQYQIPIAFDLARYLPFTTGINTPTMSPLAQCIQLKAIVLRPSEIGGLNHCQKIREQAHAQGLEVVIGDSLQSGLGQHQLAHLSQRWQANGPTALGRCRYLLDSGINDQGQPHIAGLTLLA